MSKQHWLVSFTVPAEEGGLDSRERVVEWLAAQLGSVVRKTVAVVGPIPEAKQDKE